MDYPEVGKLAREWVWPEEQEDRLLLANALGGIGAYVAQLRKVVERVDDGGRRAFRLWAGVEAFAFAAGLCCKALGQLTPAEEQWPAQEGNDGAGAAC